MQEAVESRRKKGEHFLGGVEHVLRDKLKEAGITAQVESRIKRFYSIHKKLLKQRITVDQVYDLFAMRVITHSVQDCYAVLGIIHNLWRPVPGRIKDFIAMPRPNLYQSLHTSVITEEGTSLRNSDPHGRNAPDGGRRHRGALEIQRRPGLSAGRAAAGVAAAGGRVAARCFRSQRISFHAEDRSVPGRGLHLHAEGQSRRAAARCDADRLRLHDSHRSRPHLRGREGQRAHGAAAPQAAQSGDIVEILTQPGHKPSRDWLGVVKSSRARNKIKHWLNIHQRERAIEIGQKLIEKEARKYRISLKDIKDDDCKASLRTMDWARPTI